MLTKFQRLKNKLCEYIEKKDKQENFDKAAFPYNVISIIIQEQEIEPKLTEYQVPLFIKHLVEHKLIEYPGQISELLYKVSDKPREFNLTDFISVRELSKSCHSLLDVEDSLLWLPADDMAAFFAGFEANVLEQMLNQYGASQRMSRLSEMLRVEDPIRRKSIITAFPKEFVLVSLDWNWHFADLGNKENVIAEIKKNFIERVAADSNLQAKIAANAEQLDKLRALVTAIGVAEIQKVLATNQISNKGKLSFLKFLGHALITTLATDENTFFGFVNIFPQGARMPFISWLSEEGDFKTVSLLNKDVLFDMLQELGGWGDGYDAMRVITQLAKGQAVKPKLTDHQVKSFIKNLVTHKLIEFPVQILFLVSQISANTKQFTLADFFDPADLHKICHDLSGILDALMYLPANNIEAFFKGFNQSKIAQILDQKKEPDQLKAYLTAIFNNQDAAKRQAIFSFVPAEVIFHFFACGGKLFELQDYTKNSLNNPKQKNYPEVINYFISRIYSDSVFRNLLIDKVRDLTGLYQFIDDHFAEVNLQTEQKGSVINSYVRADLLQALGGDALKMMVLTSLEAKCNAEPGQDKGYVLTDILCKDILQRIPESTRSRIITLFDSNLFAQCGKQLINIFECLPEASRVELLPKLGTPIIKQSLFHSELAEKFLKLLSNHAVPAFIATLNSQNDALEFIKLLPNKACYKLFLKSNETNPKKMREGFALLLRRFIEETCTFHKISDSVIKLIAAKAYYHMRECDTRKHARSFLFFGGYSREDKLIATKALIDSLLQGSEMAEVSLDNIVILDSGITAEFFRLQRK